MICRFVSNLEKEMEIAFDIKREGQEVQVVYFLCESTWGGESEILLWCENLDFCKIRFN